MLTLFGTLDSGNVHKVAMVLSRLERPYRRVDVSQTRGEPRRAVFLRLNPIGKVPVLMLNSGEVLSESAAILFHLSDGTSLWPHTVRAQTEVLRWLSWEQYSHEPAIAVLRYLLRFESGLDPHYKRHRVAELRPRSEHALEVMEGRLAASRWMAGESCTIADYALYPYTRVADECDLDLEPCPAVRRWLDAMEREPRHLPFYADGASEVSSFDEYFTPGARRRVGAAP